ncbi:MAG: hypothetical protein Q7R30_00985 [Acidobacteriota bacterium]|nr:hypothetical protein [Acidobacteriota bacterium]
MADPEKTSPRNDRDEYLPDAPGSHTGNAPLKPVTEGVTPQNPATMPRAEDDEKTKSNSPEFHDRPTP